MKSIHAKYETLIQLISLSVFLCGSCFAETVNIESSGFKAAFEYGISYVIFSESDLNYWINGENNEAFRMTKALHDKLGQGLKADVFGKNGDNGWTTLYVELPDLQQGRFKFILCFTRNMKDEYQFHGKFVELSEHNFDFQIHVKEVHLPENWRTVVLREFSLTRPDCDAIQSWFTDFLRFDSPKRLTFPNHLIIAPFSKRFNTRCRCYWIEGNKEIEFDLDNGFGSRTANWRVVLDLNDQNFIRAENESKDGATSSAANFALASCVRNGVVVSVGQ